MIKTTKQHPWQLLLLLAIGIFIGSFWFLFGLLTVVGASAAWWYYPLSLAPGSAIIFLVVMARRAPVPYGTGLMVLGLSLIILSAVRGSSVVTGIAVGTPVFIVGLCFAWLNKILSKVSA